MSYTDIRTHGDYRYQIETPEQIALDYDIAGIGTRAIAALIDSIILSAMLTAVIFGGTFIAGAVGTVVQGTGGGSIIPMLIIAMLVVAVFAIFSGYFILFETLWQGQTPGKRSANLRVIKVGGYPIGFYDAAIRNLVRIVDFLPVYYGFGVATMLIDGRSRRLGDLAAGTLVVKERQDLSALRLESSAPRSAFTPQTPTGSGAIPNLSRLTAHDHGVLRNYLLRRPALAPDVANRLDLQLATGLANRLEYRSDGEEAFKFLTRLNEQLGQQV